MTPTLWGRWQTRFFLLSTIGSFVTIFFVALSRSLMPFIFLALVMLLGLGWDVLYNQIQKQRWDHDWPPTLQLAAGVTEGLFVFILANTLLPLGGSPIMFGLHYAAVWIATFLASQSLMRLLFPRWRYRGGQWI